MALSNDPNVPDDSRPHRERPRGNEEELSFPSAPRAFYHRMLLETYLRNCRNGFNEKYHLITAPSDMTYEDRVALDRMESNFRGIFQDKLKDFGLAEKASELNVRILHPVVAIGRSRREYHLYVDVVSANGRCWFVDFDAASGFETGPASMQVSSIWAPGRSDQMMITRIFSLPAFNEAMSKLVASSFAEVRAEPRSFIAFGWIMQAIAQARIRGASRSPDRAVSMLGFFPLDSVEDFHWTGARKPFTFECIVENAYYVAQVSLNPQRRQPSVTLYEEVF